LAFWLIAGTLLAAMPQPAAQAAPSAQAGTPAANVCRQTAPPLVQTYVDRPNGFSLLYPDGWIFRPRSGSLPGTRSDVVWFGPDPVRTRTTNCLLGVKVAMHYLMSDATLEDMRDMTAMLEPPSLITRALQLDVAATPTPALGSVLGNPSVKLPPFWGPLSRNYLWGAERLSLESGQEYYREIGAGPVQDLDGNENQGNIVRYVIAVSPRVVLEIIGQATVPEFEAGYGRLFDQMVQQGLGLLDVPLTSTNPGPVGTSLDPGDCQAMFVMNQLDDRDFGESPFLERSAVTLRLQVRGAVVPYNPDTGEQCPGPISRVGVFLDPPPSRDAVQDISVYGLPITASAPGLDLTSAGYFLSWTLPSDLYGQRLVYIGAQLPDGRWSYVTRQINVAPPISVEIATSPRQVDIGSRITVTMRVFNNTGTRVDGVRPVLYPEQGPGAAILQTGPTYIPGACDFDPRALARTPLQEAGTGAQQPGQPLAVSLEAYNRANRNWCALFLWTFTALRSGSLSFAGTAEGRLMQTPSPMRLLSLLGDGPARPAQAADTPAQGDAISAPIATAADTQVRPPEFQLVTPRLSRTENPVTVLRDWDNPYRVELWTLVRNNSSQTIYNVEPRLALQGVTAQVVGTGFARGVAVAAGTTATFTPGLQDPAVQLGCPSVLAAGQRPLRDLQPGNSLPALRPLECVAFMTAFQLDPSTPEDQAFSVVGNITANTQHSGSLQMDTGLPSDYPEQRVQVDGLSLATLTRQDLTPADVRLGAALGAARAAPVPGAETVTNPPPQPEGPPPGSIPLFGANGPTGQVAAVAGQAVGAAIPSIACPDELELTPVPGQGVNLRVRASLLRNPEAIVFQLNDTVRVVTEVRNCTDQSLFNVHVSNLVASGTAPQPNQVVDLFTTSPATQQAFQQQQAQQAAITAAIASGAPVSPSGIAPTGAAQQGAAGAQGAQGAQGAAGAAAPGANLPAPGAPISGGGVNVQQAQQQAAVQAAAQAAGNGAGQVQAQAAAVAASQAVAGTAFNNFCTIPGFTFQNNILNEVRQLNGPNPAAVDRLPPGAIASFVSDFLIGDVRDAGGLMTFDATVQGLSGDGLLEQGRAQSFSIERFTQCMYMTASATPDTLTSGDVVEIRLTGFNSSLGFPPRRFQDVFPQSLRLLRESGYVEFELLSGPYNPITSGPILIGSSEGTSWAWRYRVTGNGCFRVRGQFSAVGLFSGSRVPDPGSITTNNAETNEVCVTAPPRPVAIPAAVTP
jgi:hypothetical protein